MTNLNDRIPQINGVIKYSFCRASLILINEGIDQLFSIATGIDDRFFRVYLAFQDQERGLLLSYNHADNNFYSASIFDAIASVVSYEERIAFGWNDSEIETIFETIIQETAHATSFVYKMVKPVRISFETSTGTDFFYGIGHGWFSFLSCGTNKIIESCSTVSYLQFNFQAKLFTNDVVCSFH